MPATPAPKRCLLVVSGLFNISGGIAVVNRLCIHALAQQGWQVDVLALSETSARVDERYIPLQQVSYRAFQGNKIAFTLAAWAALLRRGYDLVLVDHVNLAAMLAPLRYLFGMRYTVWLHGVEIFPPLPNTEGKLGLRAAQRRLANSSYTRASVSARFPQWQITACDLALDPVRFAVDEQAANSLPPLLQAVDGEQRTLGNQVILHTARMNALERYKGHDELLQAFPLIQQTHPDAQLVLAGTGNDWQRLYELAQTLPAAVQAHIFMPGYVEQALLHRLYAACYLFAMPSKGEGFGLVYLEAMSYAKPCVGGNTDATPCVVQDGVTGMLLNDPHDPAQLSTAITALLADPAQAQTLGLAGYARVQNHFTFPHFTQRFLAAIEGV